MMYRLLCLCLLSAVLSSQAIAQKVSFFGRLNLGIGAQYENLDYNGATIAYSPGGGMGLEAGLSRELIKGFDAYVSLGYQKNLAMQYESMNGVSNETSFSFGRTFLSLGASKLFELSNGTIHGITVGGGLNYNIPGTLKLIENNESFGSATYQRALGFHLDTRLILKFTDDFSLAPGIRYRSLKFKKGIVTNGTHPFPDKLHALNATGVEVSVTAFKRF